MKARRKVKVSGGFTSYKKRGKTTKIKIAGGFLPTRKPRVSKEKRVSVGSGGFI